jgi:formate hydrogenlyase subunit 3/multisubunit Na+/H+ antiporter MnhD subunit
LNLFNDSRYLALVDGAERWIAKLLGLVLLVVFGFKAAMVPLAVWLPGTYAATSAPVAATILLQWFMARPMSSLAFSFAPGVVWAKVSTTKLTVLLAAALALPETSAMAPVNTLTVAGPLSPTFGVNVAV